MRQGLFFVVLLLSGIVYYARSIEFYVSDSCDPFQVECHSLQEYATSSEEIFGNETIIYLLFLTHRHISSVTLKISNVSYLSITPTESSRVEIRCNIIAENIGTLRIIGVLIEGQVSATANEVIINSARFEGYLINLNIVETFSLIDSHFKMFDFSPTTLLELSSSKSSKIEISDSTFTVSDPRSVEIQSQKQDLTVSFVIIRADEAMVNLIRSRIIGYGYLTAGLYSELLGESLLNITNCEINQHEMNGIHIVTVNEGNTIILRNSFIMENGRQKSSKCETTYNWELPNASGLSINPKEAVIGSFTLVIDNTTFANNHDENDEPKTIEIYYSHKTEVSNSKFLNNHGTAITLYSTETFILSGSTQFVNNIGYNGGALLMFSSYLTIADNSHIIFKGNHADNVGGAVCIRNIPIQRQRSQPCFCQLVSKDPNVALTFTNNTSEKGGQHIYGATTKSDCITHYFQHMPLYNRQYPNTFSFQTSTNESLSEVSSDPTRVCLCSDNKITCAEEWSIFMDKELKPGEELIISAVVVGADLGATSGSVFARINGGSYLSYDQLEQTIDEVGICHDLRYSIPFNAESPIQLSLSTQGSTFNSDKKTITDAIQIYRDSGEIDINLLTTPIYINLYSKQPMLTCPPGLVLNDTFDICGCNSKVSNKECSFQDGRTIFRRSKNIWLARKNLSDVYSPLLINTKCPPDKCSDSNVVDTSNPDEQCRGNRTGRVCGECIGNYSLTLGSADCEDCTNNIFSIITIGFAGAGILLVLLIKVLNLTVADGYINGFIFYCNIVWVNKGMFLPPGTTEKVLRVFLAWFNLDIGVKTCLFNGLDDYISLWLQFVFPIYIWCICILLILLSRRFNLLGNNGVPVLATLFLLSYNKFFYAVISALTSTTTVEIGTGNESTINSIEWIRDANLEFFVGKHIPLFLFSFILLIFFCIPYTLAVLFSRHLNRIQHPRVNRWLLKLKPFLDSYYGPFKDKKEYWVGVLLLVRVILLIVSSVTYYGEYTFVNSAVLVLLLCSLLLYKTFSGRLYKSLWMSILENVLILNMIVLAGISFATQTFFDDEYSWLDYFEYILVGSVLLKFMILILVKIVMLIFNMLRSSGKHLDHNMPAAQGYSEMFNGMII